MTVYDNEIKDIVSFLKRPVVVATDLWDTTKTNGHELFTANFPEKLIANKMYREKLEGFVSLYATLVIKVQVNSQPFQQGRLMLQYIPYAQYMPDHVEMVNKSLAGRSGCPRVDLDLSVGTEIELRIPYVACHLQYNLVTGQGSFGSIYLVVYSQLKDQASGTGAVEYTVWAHLEDVKPSYATGANVYQGNDPQIRAFAQMENQKMHDTNVISTGVGQVSQGLTTLSKDPLLGNVLSKPAWISGKMANLLQQMGFSKPTSEAPATEIKQRYQNRMSNYNGVDTSHRLALSATNSIETNNVSGSDLDEMMINKIASIPNYWTRFTWPSTGDGSATGTTLFSDFATPYKVSPYSTSLTNVYTTTHLGFLSNIFAYWRGSLVYTFKFVKTQYHSGRLLISYIPYHSVGVLGQTEPDISKTIKMVVDLRTSTEVSFTVDFPSTRFWMHSVYPGAPSLSNGANANAYLYNACHGIIRVDVLNKLVAANNVSDSIDCIVEVSGGPDLTFAVPVAPNYIPYNGDLEAADFEMVSRPQAQMMSVDTITRNEAQTGSTPAPLSGIGYRYNWSPEANCIGEKIFSARQLIKRFAAVSNTTFDSGSNALAVAPFQFNPPVTSTTATQRYGYLDYFSTIYAFSRGGIRLKLLNFNNYGTTRYPSREVWRVRMLNGVCDNMFNWLSTIPAFSPDDPAKKWAFTTVNSIPKMAETLVDTVIEGQLEVEVPYYNVSHISPVLLSKTNSVTVENMLKGNIPASLVSMEIVSSIPETESITIGNVLYRAAADDFSFSYLIGVPLMVNQPRS